jgi:hypothetical protein
MKKNTIIGTLTLLYPFLIHAQTANDEYKLLVGSLPGIGQTSNFTEYISQGFILAIAIGAALAFVMITYGGIVYATADAVQNKQNGRKYIEDAVIGLIILIGSFAILNTKYESIKKIYSVSKNHPPTSLCICINCTSDFKFYLFFIC